MILAICLLAIAAVIIHHHYRRRLKAWWWHMRRGNSEIFAGRVKSMCRTAIRARWNREKRSAALRESLWYGFFPAALGAQDQLDHFARGAVSAGGARHVVRDLFQFRCCVRGRHGQARACK